MAIKKNVLVSLKVEIEPPSSVTRWCRSLDEEAREIEDWVKEFKAFLRDHRSRDEIDFNVVREIQDQCEHCESIWETDTDGSPLCCQKAIDEFEAAKVTA